MTTPTVETTKTSGPAGVVADFYRAARAGDFETVRALLSPEVTLTEPESVPYGGVFKGPDAVLGAAADIFTKYFNLTDYEVCYILADDEHAVARLNVAGVTHTTGKPIAFSATECFVVRDGKIIDIQPYHFDTVQVVEALTAD